ncbi:hypothetical protein EMIHUDRAFT_208902 [Emiliania huxleyi CCMP1516]|uniref:L domain-like protein n=2 Tax=Emiliania huxleyi TaxID=2903 RepID=A0A0D3J9A0_EMIH1|nr:hypothetical protein EMIHUDRAFT_208902 [Emiliania huxleyi CCMP1516]EOD20085.1 hypothetical protein EMIHUDRAFT_208902 [Emiliania huxleyi CCMP1516]|eukprot:XP_005772514.1 hypothetical protein EMIHUDRAFT_208902 [Emiliania huxleyi CCMP1516]
MGVEAYRGVSATTLTTERRCATAPFGVVLDGERISGTIPPHTINNARAGLAKLHLDNNEISGTLPPTTGELSILQQLRLSNNDLSGIIPPHLGGISGLNQLWLYSNKISGTIPPGKLSLLQQLWPSNNEISGTIPPELGGNWSWDISACTDLSGTVPSQLNNLPLTACRLGRNLFACPLPALPDCCLSSRSAASTLGADPVDAALVLEVGDTLVFIYQLWDCDVWSMPSSACDFAAAGFEYGPYQLAGSSHGGGTGAGAWNRFEYPMTDVM